MMARKPDPCGTIGAHNRHIRNHEPIDDACHRAWADYKHEAKPIVVRVAFPRLADAACATRAGMRLFANIGPDTVPNAREICRSCPVQRTCLQWGVMYEDEGMWGGLTRDELRRERHRHGIRRQEPNSTWAVPRATATQPKELAA